MKRLTPPPVKASLLSAVAILVAAALLPALQPQPAEALPIAPRRLTLQAGTTDGGSMPGGTVNHFFEFTIPSNTNVGSIQFLYCETAIGTCNTPAGLDTTGSTLGAQTGATGFTIDTDDVNGSPYITRSAAAATGAVTYRLDGVVNPSTTNETFYVRISTFASTDTSGGATDSGVVAASTATQIVLDGTMPESLVFCTGEDISIDINSVPDCSTATDGNITFDRLFSPTDTALASSEMAASTNAGTGYAITVNGDTLTSGANEIDAMGTVGASAQGTKQFGMNLKDNTTPDLGAEVAPAANGTNYRGQAVAGYNTTDQFKFATGDIVADSANGGAGGTDAQIFRVAYIVNVTGSQPAGTYTTTLTYICTPSF